MKRVIFSAFAIVLLMTFVHVIFRLRNPSAEALSKRQEALAQRTSANLQSDEINLQAHAQSKSYQGERQSEHLQNFLMRAKELQENDSGSVETLLDEARVILSEPDGENAFHEELVRSIRQLTEDNLKMTALMIEAVARYATQPEISLGPVLSTTVTRPRDGKSGADHVAMNPYERLQLVKSVALDVLDEVNLTKTTEESLRPFWKKIATEDDDLSLVRRSLKLILKNSNNPEEDYNAVASRRSKSEAFAIKDLKPLQ